MPWKETYPMCERAAFIKAHREEALESMAALCRRFGISRKTGYKWLERFEQAGEEGLLEHSRASHSHPNQTPAEIERAIIKIRRTKNFGPKKIVSRMTECWPPEAIPAISTVGDILARNGLVVPRRLRRRCTPSAQPLAHAVDSNVVWCADFKGWFCTADGSRVDPLTVTDARSRYLLGCQGMCGKTDTEHVMAVFETLFRTYGMPERIRTDNGAPFASTGLAGLSRLSVWWMRLGIVPERIRPGKPSENGRHERFHLTLKQDTLAPPASTPRKQQQRFDRFRTFYNEERPHEALGQVAPVKVYSPSARPFPERLPEPQYHDDMEVRRVRGGGQMKWKNTDVLVTRALDYQIIGLKQYDDGLWHVFFSTTCIGIFDERTLKIAPLSMKKKGCKTQ